MDKNRLFLFFFFILLTSLGCSEALSAIQDPTRPDSHTAKKKTTEKITSKKQELTAIFFKDGKGTAIINDQLFQSGDYFSGSQIVAIKTNSVLLKNSDGFHRLTLINKFKKLKK